jgi:hypothetical protein
MFAFANVTHFFAHEFAGLRGGRLPLAPVLFGSLQSFLFRHILFS